MQLGSFKGPMMQVEVHHIGCGESALRQLRDEKSRFAASRQTQYRSIT